MRFKVACGSRYNSWFKNVSKLLTIGIVLNSIPINSFAGILSEDKRYETFKDNYIVADDVLEEDKVDMEIEGNTLVNYMDYSTMTTNSGTIINRDTKEITFGNSISENSSPYTDMDLYSRPNLKPGETYTIIVNVLENTISGSQFFALLDSWQDYMPNEGARISHGKTGIVKAKFTVKESNNGLFKMYLRNYKDQDNRGILKIKDLMILEGDWTDREAPQYFEGMKSVGEKSDVNEIELIANNRNLFDIDNATNMFISPEGTTLFNADLENKTSDFIKIEPNSIYLYNVENFVDTNGLWTGYAFYREKDMNSVIDSRITINSLNDIAIKTPEDANYIRIGSRYLQQEGVKVYFQKVNSNYSNNNENLFDINNATNQFILPGGTALANADAQNKTSDFIKIEPNSFYLYNVENFTNTNGLWTGYAFYKEKDMNSVIDNRVVTYSLTDVLIKTPKDANYLRIGSRYLQQEGVKVELRKIAELSNFKYEEFTQDIKSIALNEPLRGLSNVVRDRITKRNGQWVVERNCGELLLDGTESWCMPNRVITSANLLTFEYALQEDITIGNGDELCISNLFSKTTYNKIYNYNVEGIGLKSWLGYTPVRINIDKNKLDSPDVNGLKLWLSRNNIKLIYRLKEPIYEPLKIDLSLQLFEDATYISNNSIIPANVKVTIDRTANRAKEAIKIAKANPTIENISKARYWTNLMRESTLKDKFQDEINTNIDVVDLSIEKKNVSANVDIYLKMKNSLSLSLDTNSIMFDEFNASEDLEMKNAVNLTVSSSLPYKINAYLEDEIYNADKTATIDRSVLNIKVNTDSDYKAFADISTPLLLLDNQMEGNNITYGLDLVLRGGNTHKADVYKTTIKFEVEQK